MAKKRGRPPSAKTLVDRQLGRDIKHPTFPAGDSFIVPNLSGDLSKAHTGTPIEDLAAANKAYVDSQTALYLLLDGTNTPSADFTWTTDLTLPDLNCTNLKADHIAEKTERHNILIDDHVKVDTISENTVDAGVDVESVVFENGNISASTTNATADIGQVRIRDIAGSNSACIEKDDGTLLNEVIIKADGIFHKDVELGIEPVSGIVDGYKLIVHRDATSELDSSVEIYSDQFRRPIINLKTGSGAQSIIDATGGTLNINSAGDGVHMDNTLTVASKIKLITTGGYAIALTNTTGGNTVKGQVVCADPVTDDAVVVCGLDDVNAIGVFLDAGVADDAEAWVVVSGICDTLADDVGFSKGDRLVASGNVAGTAEAANAPAVAEHFQEIGHAIEDAAANTLGRIVLHFN